MRFSWITKVAPYIVFFGTPVALLLLYVITGSIPVTYGFCMSENYVRLPFGISRLLDIIFLPLLVYAFAHAIDRKWPEMMNFRVLVIFGAICGGLTLIMVNLVAVFVIGLVVGIFFGLIMGSDTGLRECARFGVTLGTSFGIGFGAGYGIVFGLISGFTLGIIADIVMGLAFALVVFVGCFTGSLIALGYDYLTESQNAPSPQ